MQIKIFKLDDSDSQEKEINAFLNSHDLLEKGIKFIDDHTMMVSYMEKFDGMSKESILIALETRIDSVCTSKLQWEEEYRLGTRMVLINPGDENAAKQLNKAKSNLVGLDTSLEVLQRMHREAEKGELNPNLPSGVKLEDLKIGK